jgi:hypothetical protein
MDKAGLTHGHSLVLFCCYIIPEENCHRPHLSPCTVAMPQAAAYVLTIAWLKAFSSVWLASQKPPAQPVA